MSIILDDNTLFLSSPFKGWFAKSSQSQGYQDYQVGTYTPTVKYVGIDTTNKLTNGFNTYFKLQGYNPVTGQYEVWHCMNTPVFTPPSGDTLLNVSVVSTWIDR